MSVSVSFNPYQCDLSPLTVRLFAHIFINFYVCEISLLLYLFKSVTSVLDHLNLWNQNSPKAGSNGLPSIKPLYFVESSLDRGAKPKAATHNLLWLIVSNMVASYSENLHSVWHVIVLLVRGFRVKDVACGSFLKHCSIVLNKFCIIKFIFSWPQFTSDIVFIHILFLIFI